MTRLALSVLLGSFAVCRLAADAEVPGWALAGAFFTVSRTADELSVVCEAHLVPESVRFEDGWRALKLHGPFDFGLTGILAAVLNPLAAAGVGIFAVSTFDTDYVLVKEAQLDAALNALREAGHSLR